VIPQQVVIPDSGDVEDEQVFQRLSDEVVTVVKEVGKLFVLIFFRSSGNMPREERHTPAAEVSECETGDREEDQHAIEEQVADRSGDLLNRWTRQLRRLLRHQPHNHSRNHDPQQEHTNRFVQIHDFVPFLDLCFRLRCAIVFVPAGQLLGGENQSDVCEHSHRHDPMQVLHRFRVFLFCREHRHTSGSGCGE